MKRAILAAAALAAAMSAGCPSHEVRIIEGRTEWPGGALWDHPLPAPSEPGEGTTYFEPDEAPRSPEISVAPDPHADRRRTLQTAREGYVTIIVAGGMVHTADKAALRHVRDLLTKYNPNTFRIRAIGIVQRTRFYDRASEFAHDQKIDYPLYYDDVGQSALRRLANAADADEPRVFPAIFIADRQGRLRFYRGGFSAAVTSMGDSAAGTNDGTRVGEEVIIENAREGHTVMDYLEHILSGG